MSKMKTNEIIEAARFLVAYGDELDAEEGFSDAVDQLLGKAEDKISALAYVVGVMSRSYGALLSRSAENVAAATRYEKRRGFLATMREKLAQEAVELAEAEGDQDTVDRLRTLLEADPVVQGYLLTMPSGAVEDASDYEQRRWAEQVLTVTVGDAKRAGKIVEAVKAHDDQLLAARLLIRTGADRAAHLKALAKELNAAAKDEDDIVEKVKGLAATRLRKVDGNKHTDSLGGWIRITERNTAIAVDPSWKGKGKAKGPDVDKLPDEYVKTIREPLKRELTNALKALHWIRTERAMLAGDLADADTDEERAGIKAAIEGLGDDAPIPGAKLHMKPSSFISTSK